MAVSEWGEVIEYLDGYAWGITPTGKTICLGRETAVKAAIANPLDLATMKYGLTFKKENEAKEKAGVKLDPVQTNVQGDEMARKTDARKLKCGKPEVDAIIELERNLLEDIKTQNGKQPNIQRPGAFRNRTDGKTKHRAAHIKPAAFRKRLPGNPSKH